MKEEATLQTYVRISQSEVKGSQALEIIWDFVINADSHPHPRPAQNCCEES